MTSISSAKRASVGAIGLSDTLAPRYGEAEGLVYALLITSLIYLWAGAHYLLAGRHLARDLAAVREASPPAA